MTILLVLLWFLTILIQAYNIFIRESIQSTIKKGYPPIAGVPTPFWKGKRLLIFRIIAFIFPLFPLVLTYLNYGFWTAVIVASVIYMVSYGLGYGRISFLEGKSKNL